MSGKTSGNPKNNASSSDLIDHRLARVSMPLLQRIDMAAELPDRCFRCNGSIWPRSCLIGAFVGLDVPKHSINVAPSYSEPGVMEVKSREMIGVDVKDVARLL